MKTQAIKPAMQAIFGVIAEKQYGTYILLNGTEHDYAEYLINKKN